MTAQEPEFWTRAIDALVLAFEEAEVRLCGYDGAIGDGDHGTSMLHGFREAQESLRGAPAVDAGDAFRRAGEAFLEKVGGVTGIVFGSMFEAAGRCAAGLPGLDAGALHRMFAAGLASAKKRGGATEGDKSMIDALSPAVDALRAAAESDETAEAALSQAARAAEAGMEAAITMEAKVGRARYQSGKGRGHVDAGAASICLLFQTLAAARRAATLS
jgi:phosphoenolpyruvate---glycerone phosphotransferase subunit DhaL